MAHAKQRNVLSAAKKSAIPSEICWTCFSSTIFNYLSLHTHKKKFTGDLSRFVLFVYIQTRFYTGLYYVYVYKVK
jgi:hypothetical protein